MRQVLAAEGGAVGVGLVVFSGDQLTGNNVYANATTYLSLVVNETVEAGIPFASIFGNHDDAPLQRGPRSARSLSTTGRRALLAYERAQWPALSLSCGDADTDGCPTSLAPSVTNYFLLVRNTSGAPVVVLYFLDSGGGSYPEELYGDVTSWLAATAATLIAAHGPLPSITFVHIPPPEYASAAGTPGCVGLADDGVTPTLGTNALVATLRAMGTARVITVGHDHGNAWCCPGSAAASPHLCFGRHSGYGGYGDWARGARVFELSADATARGGVALRTWVRMEDGSVNSEQVLE